MFAVVIPIFCLQSLINSVYFCLHERTQYWEMAESSEDKESDLVAELGCFAEPFLLLMGLLLVCFVISFKGLQGVLFNWSNRLSSLKLLCFKTLSPMAPPGRCHGAPMRRRSKNGRIDQISKGHIWPVVQTGSKLLEKGSPINSHKFLYLLLGLFMELRLALYLPNTCAYASFFSWAVKQLVELIYSLAYPIMGSFLEQLWPSLDDRSYVAFTDLVNPTIFWGRSQRPANGTPSTRQRPGVQNFLNPNNHRTKKSRRGEYYSSRFGFCFT